MYNPYYYANKRDVKARVYSNWIYLSDKDDTLYEKFFDSRIWAFSNKAKRKKILSILYKDGHTLETFSYLFGEIVKFVKT